MEKLFKYQVEVLHTCDADDKSNLATNNVVLHPGLLANNQFKYPLNYFIEYVDKVIDLYNLYSSEGNVIFIGDFNAKIDDDTPSKNTRERYLSNAINQCNSKVMTSKVLVPLSHRTVLG